MDREMININANLVKEAEFRKYKKYGKGKEYTNCPVYGEKLAGVGVLKTLITAIGAGLGAWGVINLMEAYANDNPGAISQGKKPFMAK